MGLLLKPGSSRGQDACGCVWLYWGHQYLNSTSFSRVTKYDSFGSFQQLIKYENQCWLTGHTHRVMAWGRQHEGRLHPRPIRSLRDFRRGPQPPVAPGWEDKDHSNFVCCRPLASGTSSRAAGGRQAVTT